MQRHTFNAMTDLQRVRFLVGNSPDGDLGTFLETAARLPTWHLFDERVARFIGAVSGVILKNLAIRQHPELIALGHWFRPAHLRSLQRSMSMEDNHRVRLGRGLVFHLAPSNVDSIFLYSSFLSLLAGNVNLIRVSQRANVQLDALLEVLRDVLSTPEHGEIRSRLAIVTYPHDRVITELISKQCMMRVVWGGDSTVRSIREIPLRPLASELCFPDRFSLMAVDAAAIVDIEEKELSTLARRFYNDAFWFAQQACSSPRMVVWVGGDESVLAARARFWRAVQTEVSHRSPENSSGMTMERVTTAVMYAAKGAAALTGPIHLGSFPLRLDVTAAPTENLRESHCGNGLFLEMTIPTLRSLGQFLSAKDQTLAVFGFKRETLLDFLAGVPARSLDRIVPVGDALTFDSAWDGQDLLTSFSRIVTVSPG